MTHEQRILRQHVRNIGNRATAYMIRGGVAGDQEYTRLWKAWSVAVHYYTQSYK